MKIRIGIGILAYLIAMPLTALGAADDATRAAARTLGYDGVAAFKQGDYASATDKLQRAFKVVRVPTLGLWLARALEKTGKLIEASERYAEVIRLDVSGSGSQMQAQRKAQAEATEEQQQLVKRIPSIRLVVRAPDSESVEVTIDGAAVPSALFGVARPVNPGEHTVVAKYVGKERMEQVTLAEGATQDVTLAFGNEAVGPAEAQAKPANASTDQRSTARPQDSSSSWKKTAGWIGIGVGAVGIAVGSTTGLLAWQQHSASSDECPNGGCPKSQWDTADRVNLLRTVSTVSFIVGAVGAGAGSALLVLAPRTKTSHARLAPWLGLGSAGIRGSF